MSKELEKLMIEQLRNEIESGYIYLGMASAMASIPLPGCAKWMRDQAREEVEHGMKFFDFLGARGANVELLPIAQASTDYKCPIEAFETALKHEQKVTWQIHRMYDLAVKEKDYESQNFLNWFISEQVEEEEQTQHMLSRLKFAGKDACAILHIDKEAGMRDN